MPTMRQAQIRVLRVVNSSDAYGSPIRVDT